MQRTALLTMLLSLAAGAAPLTKVLARSGPVVAETIALPGLTTGSQYGLLYSLNSLAGLGADSRIEVQIRQGSALLASKTLHAGDADYYVQFRVPKAGTAQIAVKPVHTSGKYTLQVNRWPVTALVKSLPGQRWQDAIQI